MIYIYNPEHPKECILIIALYMELLCFFSNVQVGQGYIQIKVRHPAQISCTAIGQHMLIYADDVYKFSMASIGVHAIYFVFHKTLCWISTPYENYCTEVAPQCIPLRSKSASEKFGREVAPPHFHFDRKMAHFWIHINFSSC